MIGTVDADTGVTVRYSYSTCSVKGKSAGGGFVGITKPGANSIQFCYCTGRVDWSNYRYYGPANGNNKRDFGAFAGNLAGGTSVSDCQYFEIVNEIMPVQDPMPGTSPN